MLLHIAASLKNKICTYHSFTENILNLNFPKIYYHLDDLEIAHKVFKNNIYKIMLCSEHILCAYSFFNYFSPISSILTFYCIIWPKLDLLFQVNAIFLQQKKTPKYFKTEMGENKISVE